MSEHAYCTYFDSGYLSRGRALVETLREQGDSGPVYILALDDAAYAEVAHWSHLGVVGVSLAELERTFPRLLDVREQRSRMEYLFTLTPWLTSWTLDRVPENGWATYLDADMAFFSSTESLYEEAKDASIAIVEHRFTWEQAWRRKYGRFNVAWVGFRNDARGRTCLEWWAESCLAWCYDEVSDGRFADQGYLDRFPDFPGVAILANPGADVAPWNLRRHQISRDPSGPVLVDGVPLVFFHFHGLRKDGDRYHFKHLPYLARTTLEIKDGVYRPYCERLEAIEQQTGSDRAQVLARRPTLAGSLKSGRDETLRWLGLRRGDYVDISHG